MSVSCRGRRVISRWLKQVDERRSEHHAVGPGLCAPLLAPLAFHIAVSRRVRGIARYVVIIMSALKFVREHGPHDCAQAQQQRLSVGATPGLNGSFSNGFGQLPGSFAGPMGGGADPLHYGGAAAAAAFRWQPAPGSRR